MLLRQSISLQYIIYKNKGKNNDRDIYMDVYNNYSCKCIF